MDLSTLPRRTLGRVLPVDDATALVGTRVPTLRPTVELRQPGLWFDADSGDPVLGIFPCPELPTLRQVILSSRSGRSGTAVTFGSRPRKPAQNGQEGCVLTAFNRDFPDAAAFLGHYSDVMAGQLAATFPDVVEQGRAAVLQVLPDWRLSSSSLWTSGVINTESSLPYHRDGNNFEAWSVMPVIRRGVRGGHLHIPEYGVVVPCRDGQSVAFFGQQLVHGVTPMEKVTPDGYRVSIVFYALRGLKNCHDYAEETAFALRRRTEREQSIARGEGRFNGQGKVTAQGRVGAAWEGDRR